MGTVWKSKIILELASAPYVETPLEKKYKKHEKAKPEPAEARAAFNTIRQNPPIV